MKNKKIKLIENGIDAMIDLQDEGLGNNAIAAVLDDLNSQKHQLEESE